ncbi:hypothetical protein GDO81_011372 [Engystomops pustulosus]|uniref:Uncharacterized protein n=1 Tax=Engystomops pustulosus TaxID=76066 RepID=A0AAV7BE50_ENGPU|nr:hypothetical protein GDO81_011372 [Engystomops pustulosus]
MMQLLLRRIKGTTNELHDGDLLCDLQITWDQLRHDRFSYLCSIFMRFSKESNINTPLVDELSIRGDLHENMNQNSLNCQWIYVGRRLCALLLQVNK